MCLSLSLSLLVLNICKTYPSLNLNAYMTEIQKLKLVAKLNSVKIFTLREMETSRDRDEMMVEAKTRHPIMTCR